MWVRARKSCQHHPLIPWQEGTWLGSWAHVSMARLPGTGFPTVTQGHDCTGALTSRKSSDKVKIELCSLGASGPAEVLSLCSPADNRDMKAGAFPAPRARPSHKGCSAAGSDTICPVGRSIRETVFPRTIPLNALWKTIPFPAGANLLSGSGSANVFFAVPLYQSRGSCHPFLPSLPSRAARCWPGLWHLREPSAWLALGGTLMKDGCKWISHSHRLRL